MSEGQQFEWEAKDLGNVGMNLFMLEVLDFNHLSLSLDSEGRPNVGFPAQRLIAKAMTLKVADGDQIVAHAGHLYRGWLVDGGMAVEQQFVLSTVMPSRISPDDGFDILLYRADEDGARKTHAITKSPDALDDPKVKELLTWLSASVASSTSVAFSMRGQRAGLLLSEAPEDGGFRAAMGLRKFAVDIYESVKGN